MFERSFFLRTNFALGVIACAVALVAKVSAEELYVNDFDAPVGTSFPEWTSTTVRYKSSANPPGAGTVAPQAVANCESTNGAQRFLGEFGGPKIGSAADPGYNRTTVDQTIRLSLRDMPPHRALRLSFDLYVLKSWDGNSPQYGPDRLRISVADGPVLLDTSFSNNHKVERQSSYQDHPQAKSLPQTSALSTNTLAYDFFGDAIYGFEFTFPHRGDDLQIDFASSLFEGKGTDDESWGLDNVRVEAVHVETDQAAE